MNAPTRPQPQPPVEPSIIPETGWHCSHYFYRFRRDVPQPADPAAAREAFLRALEPAAEQRPERLQLYLISGHKADFAVAMMDPDPLKVEHVHQSLMSGPLGAAIEPTWSFVSVSEISEYVPTVEQYRERLIAGGIAADAPEMAAKLNAYERRLPMMTEQRLRPEFPDWPVACFYPMNKTRVVGANWFTEPFSRRAKMMGEHAQSGIQFAGRVTQMVTVGVGLDDWEWMVTLWAKNPQFLKDIVYRMRYDEASAHYGEFGPFYVGYLKTATEILDFCQPLR
ncbi:hydrogen peroxide-dependent heme synthase [Planctomycetaceae bacterium SH139]